MAAPYSLSCRDENLPDIPGIPDFSAARLWFRISPAIPDFRRDNNNNMATPVGAAMLDISRVKESARDVCAVYLFISNGGAAFAFTVFVMQISLIPFKCRTQ